MLDITDSKLFQNFLSTETQLLLFVTVLLISALMVLKYCKMDLLRVSQQKQHFYQIYDNFLVNHQFKFLRCIVSKPNTVQISEVDDIQPTSSTATISVSSSCELPSIKPVVDADSETKFATALGTFHNNSPSRPCEMCIKYEKSLREARRAIENASNKSKSQTDWNATSAKVTLEKYERFIKRIMADYDKLKQDKEIITVHVNNLNRAFENLQGKYIKAKDTLSAFERNERALLSQLGKYEMVFQLIQDRTVLFQEQELRSIADASGEKPSAAHSTPRKIASTATWLKGKIPLDREKTVTHLPAAFRE